MVRTEFNVEIFITMDAPFGGRTPTLFPDPGNIAHCCDFLGEEIKKEMKRSSNWDGGSFESGTTFDLMSTHVKITSLPPHAGKLKVDLKFYVDRPTLYEGYYNATRLVAKFPIYRISNTFEAYSPTVDEYFTAPAGTASPQFDTKDYYCVFGPL